MTPALLKALQALHAATGMPKSNPAKRKAPAKKKPARTIGSPSRTTGKKPSARLMKRRAKDTVPGYYPNPKKKTPTVAKKQHYYVMLPEKFSSEAAAAKHAKTFADKHGVAVHIVKG